MFYQYHEGKRLKLKSHIIYFLNNKQLIIGIFALYSHKHIVDNTIVVLDFSKNQNLLDVTTNL